MGYNLLPWKKMDRLWIRYFTPYEWMVLVFIRARTFSFKKDREYIPKRHFVDGVQDRNGECVQVGLPLARTTVKKVIKRLEKRGVIRSGRGAFGGTKWYEINLDADVKKRSAAGTIVGRAATVGGRPKNGTGSRNRPPIRLIKKGENIKLGKRTAARCGRPCAIKVSKVRVSGKLSEAAPNLSLANVKPPENNEVKRPANNAKASSADCETFWHEAVREHHPAIPIVAWTIKERMAVFRALDRIEKIEPRKLIEYAVSHWNKVVAWHLRKRSCPPVYPMPLYFAACIEIFVGAMTGSNPPTSLRSQPSPESLVQINASLSRERDMYAAELDGAIARTKQAERKAADAFLKFRKLEKKQRADIRPWHFGLPEWEDGPDCPEEVSGDEAKKPRHLKICKLAVRDKSARTSNAVARSVRWGASCE